MKLVITIETKGEEKEAAVNNANSVVPKINTALPSPTPDFRNRGYL